MLMLLLQNLTINDLNLHNIHGLCYYCWNCSDNVFPCGLNLQSWGGGLSPLHKSWGALAPPAPPVPTPMESIL